MATTLDTETNLNVTISEEVIQNGVKQNNINTVTIPVKKVYRRVRTITRSNFSSTQRLVEPRTSRNGFR